MDTNRIDQLYEYANNILVEAKNQGAESAQVQIFDSVDIGTRYGEKHITQNVYKKEISFELKTQIENKIGTYTGPFPLKKNLSKYINDAVTLTRFSAPDPEFPGFLDQQPHYIPLQTTLTDMNAQTLAETISNIIDRASNSSPLINSVAGNLHYTFTSDVFLNSYEVEASNQKSIISGVINIAATKNEEESRSTKSIAGININNLNIDMIVDEVAQRALLGLNQTEIDPGHYEAVLGHGAVEAILRFVVEATSSEGVITHTSFLKDVIGEQIFDTRLTLIDDTYNPDHFAGHRYDNEGVPSPPITFIEKGILKDYAYNRRNARKLNTESNGRNSTGFSGERPIYSSVVLSKGSKTEQELIAQIDNGVYITNLFYNNFVDPPEGTCTGLTRDGLFRIKNGEIVGALKNMRWSDSIKSIFQQVEPANNSLQVAGFFFGSMITPSIRVGSFNFSSKGKH